MRPIIPLIVSASGLGGFAYALTAPVLDWDDDTADNTPDFNIDFGPDAAEDDVIRVQYDDNASFTSPNEATDTLDAAEILAGEIDLGLSALADGTWYVRARLERGAALSRWSN